ncbi:hypothetical protein IL306_000345 [Fusarium sp. DS 682]|nr:hypothetical protein IL306_000345 [Fusarium sp. DS 682]
MASSTPDISFILPQLPRELTDTVSHYLGGNDAKNLRATCSTMAKTLPLHFDRVYISANSLNLEVFNAIAAHETFRHQVTEIIWDDAPLYSGPELWEWREEYEYDTVNGSDPEAIVAANQCPLWFVKGRADYGNTGSYILPKIHQGLEESWAHYKPLLEDHRRVLAAHADIEAFKYGLQRFPSLKRVTITPSTHGRLGKPLYRTPMIRAFPPGFDYPLPQAWPQSTMTCEWQDELPWISDEGDRPYQFFYGPDYTAEKYRQKWRGYRLVSRALVECENQVMELVIGGNEIDTGLSSRIFDQPCVEYDNFRTLLKRPGFRYLDLHLFTGAIECEDWISYTSGLLGGALAQAKDIEHLCIRASTEITHGYPERLDPEDLEKPVFPSFTWDCGL